MNSRLNPRWTLPGAWFAARGWVLAALFLALVFFRATVSRADAPLRWEMLALVAAGMGLRAWAGAHLGSHGNGARAEAPALATSGPYAFSRNPLYLSNMAVGAGLMFFANALPAPAAVALLAFLFLHHVALALWEEKQLRRFWPEAYAAYAAATPRWFGLKPPRANVPGAESGGAPLALQGRNLAYAVACVLILWAAARSS
jgi:protein-S-isoprenylcysteine O-methyltransferase Ste14